jgi:hypothetical protein
MAQTGTGASQIVRSELVDAGAGCRRTDNVFDFKRQRANSKLLNRFHMSCARKAPVDAKPSMSAAPPTVGGSPFRP